MINNVYDIYASKGGNVFQMNTVKKLCRCWPVVVCILCLVISVGAYAVYGQHNLDSDISSEFVLAQLLNDEGRFFLTDSWFYSTELRIVSPVPVYQLALMLFEDWHMARTASIAVLLIGVMAAMTYMLRGMGASYTSALLCASALILPITEYNSFTLVYGGFYTVCVMLAFIQIGLVLRMDKKRILEPVLLVLLGVYGGLNGVRMLMICVAPLLAACVILFFMEARRCAGIKEIVKTPAFWLFCGGLILAAATGIGYYINGHVLARQYDFALYDETVIAPLSAQMFTDQIMALVSFFGYRNYSQLLSMEGVISVFAMLLPFVGVGAMILLLRMNLHARERLLAMFALIALLMGMLINVLTLGTDGGSSLPYTVSYYMPAALLLVYAIFWVFDRFECRMKWLRVLPMIALVGVFLAGNSVYRDKDMNTYETELEDIAYTLLDEAAYEGYATFWNANVLTEITNAELDVFSVEEWEYGTINEWLQRKDHLDRTPWGRTFAVLRAQDWNDDMAQRHEANLVYSSDNFYVVVYDSDEEFREANGW